MKCTRCQEDHSYWEMELLHVLDRFGEKIGRPNNPRKDPYCKPCAEIELRRRG